MPLEDGGAATYPPSVPVTDFVICPLEALKEAILQAVLNYTAFDLRYSPLTAAASYPVQQSACSVADPGRC